MEGSLSPKRLNGIANQKNPTQRARLQYRVNNFNSFFKTHPIVSIYCFYTSNPPRVNPTEYQGVLGFRVNISRHKRILPKVVLNKTENKYKNYNYGT
jgi:hypothetical protein